MTFKLEEKQENILDKIFKTQIKFYKDVTKTEFHDNGLPSEKLHILSIQKNLLIQFSKISKTIIINHL